MRVYATEQDVQEWSEDTSPVATAALRRASSLVEYATRLDRYEVDTDGYPTETAVKNAMQNATCAQVAFWSAAGIDPTAGAVGQTARLSSQSVPAGSVSYQGVLGAAELGTAATSLCDEAYTIIYNAGLMRAQVTIL